MEPQPSVALYEYLRSVVDTATTTSLPYPQFALVEAYWHIGRIIVEIEQSGQQRADYGIHLIEHLSDQLTANYGKGYSLANMWRFKQFFLAFPILSTKRRELPNLREHLRIELAWSHYRLLMPLKNLQERAFYLNQAADERWNVRLLQKLIRSRYYYQTALGQDQLLANPKKIVSSPTFSVESGSSRTRLAQVKKLLLERYVGYAFVAQRQFISVNGQDHWIELLFFHIVLQRYVLIQLGEHDPGQLAFYVQLLDTYFSKQPSTVTQPPIGLLINNQGQVKWLTVSFENILAIEEAAVLPQAF